MFPDACIRLCQFHAVQAITRFDTDDGTRGVPLRISVDLKVHIIFNFRILQRCRDREDWPAARDAFLETVKEQTLRQPFVTKSKKDAPALTPEQQAMAERFHSEKVRAEWEAIRQYFMDHWFVEEWIREGLSACHRHGLDAHRCARC